MCVCFCFCFDLLLNFDPKISNCLESWHVQSLVRMVLTDVSEWESLKSSVIQPTSNYVRLRQIPIKPVLNHKYRRENVSFFWKDDIVAISFCMSLPYLFIFCWQEFHLFIQLAWTLLVTNHVVKGYTVETSNVLHLVTKTNAFVVKNN